MEYNKPHTHRWNFLMTKTAFNVAVPPVLPDRLADHPKLLEFLTQPVYSHVEYAYLICNGPHADHQPIVVKTEIKNLDEVELANGKD